MTTKTKFPCPVPSNFDYHVEASVDYFEREMTVVRGGGGGFVVLRRPRPRRPERQVEEEEATTDDEQGGDDRLRLLPLSSLRPSAASSSPPQSSSPSSSSALLLLAEAAAATGGNHSKTDSNGGETAFLATNKKKRKVVAIDDDDDREEEEPLLRQDGGGGGFRDDTTASTTATSAAAAINNKCVGRDLEAEAEEEEDANRLENYRTTTKKKKNRSTTTAASSAAFETVEFDYDFIELLSGEEDRDDDEEEEDGDGKDDHQNIVKRDKAGDGRASTIWFFEIATTRRYALYGDSDNSDGGDKAVVLRRRSSLLPRWTSQRVDAMLYLVDRRSFRVERLANEPWWDCRSNADGDDDALRVRYRAAMFPWIDDPTLRRLCRCRIRRCLVDNLLDYVDWRSFRVKRLPGGESREAKDGYEEEEDEEDALQARYRDEIVPCLDDPLVRRLCRRWIQQLSPPPNPVAETLSVERGQRQLQVAPPFEPSKPADAARANQMSSWPIQHEQSQVGLAADVDFVDQRKVHQATPVAAGATTNKLRQDGLSLGKQSVCRDKKVGVPLSREAPVPGKKATSSSSSSTATTTGACSHPDDATKPSSVLQDKKRDFASLERPELSSPQSPVFGIFAATAADFPIRSLRETETGHERGRAASGGLYESAGCTPKSIVKRKRWGEERSYNDELPLDTTNDEAPGLDETLECGAQSRIPKAKRAKSDESEPLGVTFSDDVECGRFNDYGAGSEDEDAMKTSSKDVGLDVEREHKSNENVEQRKSRKKEKREKKQKKRKRSKEHRHKSKDNDKKQSKKQSKKSLEVATLPPAGATPSSEQVRRSLGAFSTKELASMSEGALLQSREQLIARGRARQEPLMTAAKLPRMKIAESRIDTAQPGAANRQQRQSFGGKPSSMREHEREGRLRYPGTGKNSGRAEQDLPARPGSQSIPSPSVEKSAPPSPSNLAVHPQQESHQGRYHVNDSENIDEQPPEKSLESTLEAFSLMPPVRILCSEKFLERWPAVFAELSSGRWVDGVDASLNGPKVGVSGRKIQLFDSDLLDGSIVDIELPGRDALVVVQLSDFETGAKDIVLSITRLSAQSIYRNINVFLVYDVPITKNIIHRLTQLETAAFGTAANMPSRVVFKTTTPGALSCSIATATFFSSPEVGEGMQEIDMEKEISERARFLMSIAPMLSATGAVQVLSLARALEPSGTASFAMLFTSQEFRDDIASNATDAVHPDAMDFFSRAVSSDAFAYSS